jgi:hypothetical protein
MNRDDNVTVLTEWLAEREGETLFQFRIAKFSERRTMLIFDDEPRDCVTLDRYNFEKMVREIRKMMGWE